MSAGSARTSSTLAEQAWAMVQERFPLAATRGSELFACLNRCVAAKIALRARQDPELALEILRELDTHPVARYRYVEELIRTWRGTASLRLDLVQEGIRDAERAVTSMVEGDRILELPTAAVLLAEARWRVGDETGADQAADLAISAAERQRSDHLLLQALGEFPAVLSRRLDAITGTDSRWHSLGRTLRTEPSTEPQRSAVKGAIHIYDFGKPAVAVGGEVVQARLTKAIEMLVFLKQMEPPHQASRPQMMEALFEGRADGSARSYLRQAVYWLCRALPEGVLEVETGGNVRLVEASAVTSDFDRATALLGDSVRQQGPSGAGSLRAALELMEKGEYLAGLESAWILDRRQQIEDRLQEAEQSVADCAYREGRLADARLIAEETLGRNPYREEVWRLLMRSAGELGDEAAVIAAYTRCREALTEIGIDVAPATTDLFVALRR